MSSTIWSQLFGVFATAFVVGLSGAMMPGPLLAVTVEESTRRGAVAGPLLILGHAVLEAAFVIALVAGLGAYLQNARVVGGIAVLGGGMLLWMGSCMVVASRHVTLDVQDKGRKRMHPLLAGIVVSLSNPYWAIWWITIGSGYVVMGMRFGMKGLVAFFVGHILSDLAWYTLVSVGVAKGRQFLSVRCYRSLVAGCGVVVLLFGVWFLRAGVFAFCGRLIIVGSGS